MTWGVVRLGLFIRAYKITSRIPVHDVYLPFGLPVDFHITTSRMVISVMGALEAHRVTGDVSVAEVAITATRVFATSGSVPRSARILL